MYLLRNTVQPYAWGSRTAIAELLGEPTPAPSPQAELWMGAHPSAPSHARRGETWHPLDALIAAEPEHALGERTLHAHGPRLPFLLKVLAAEQPLSLQAHPDPAQAREGFAREEAAGIPRDAAQRSYKDPYPKPELLCALTPFEALCGFRPVRETLALLDALGDAPPIARARTHLRERADTTGLRALFTHAMSLTGAARAELARATAAAVRYGHRGEHADSFALAARLAAQYPEDPGVFVALLLRFVKLAPGEALYLPAGNMHAYVSGTGVEIMAGSDNVLRGGLTPKHVDVPELLRVLEFRDEPIPVVRPRDEHGEAVYDTPAREFRLARIDLGPAGYATRVHGPEILLCTAGACTLTAGDGTRVDLARGGSVFVPARTQRYSIAGTATLFRATVPT